MHQYFYDFFSFPVTPLVSNKDIPPPPVTHRPSTNRYVTTPTSRSVRPPPVVTARLESKGSILDNSYYKMYLLNIIFKVFCPEF